ncbi:MAG: DUF924 family protein [Xanthomonadales bacterium]|nr:DUF924 family protein [Xanthomonadales bacterium]
MASSRSDVEAILRFWFGEPPLEPRGKLWWGGGEQVDHEIRERFGPLIDAGLAGDFEQWATAPRSMLALIILLDQFPRNIHRGTARAFAGDPRAQALVSEGLDLGFDQALHPLERSFFYMPLEHAESLDHQELCVECFLKLVEEAPAELADYLQSNLDYAREHRDVIARFGRFPHRNAALGRETTAEEAAYLEGGGKRFGQ